VSLAVEGEATLEEAVLIIARYHLHISPLTLNLFGFRQVPLSIHSLLPHHSPLPPSHLTPHPQPLRLQTGPSWYSFIAPSSLPAVPPSHLTPHPQPLRLQTGPSKHSFIAPSSLPATTFTSRLSPSTSSASDRSLLAFIHCSLIIARYHLHISPLTFNLFGFRQVSLAIYCSLYTAQCFGSERDFFLIRILTSMSFRIRIVIRICLRIRS